MPNLKVDIVSAKTPSKGDFVCNITCGKAKQKTKIVKKTNTPEWNESFTLPVEESDTLKIELTEVKSLGSKVLGALSVSLSTLTKGQQNSKVELLPDKSELKVNITAVDFGRASAPAPVVSDTKPKGKFYTRSTYKFKLEAEMLSAMLPPMPSEVEVNRMYKELMEQIGFGKDFKHPTSYQTKQMAELSLENKWALLCQYKTIEVQKSQGKIEDTPQYWTNKIREGPNLKLLRDLRIVLGGESLPWLQNFIESGGLVNLLDILSSIEQNIHRRSMSQLVTKEDEQVEMQLETVRCLQTLMNNKTGLSGAINIENGIKTLTLCLDMPHEDVRLRISKILTVVCLMPPDGHRLVVDAMTAFKTLKKEKYRFENLLIQLATALSIEAKTVLLTFINAIVNSPTDIDLRVSLRNEFQKGGLDDIIKNLKERLNSEADPDLETQIDVYDEESNLDYKELKERFDSYNININDADAVFKTLKDQVGQAGLATNLLHALQNLLIIPVMTDKGSKSFLLACRVLRQISLNKERIGASDDTSTGGFNLGDLLVSVDTESKEVPLNKKIEELTGEINILIKKCQTLEIELKEKEDKITSLRADLKSGGGGSGTGTGSGEPVFDGPPPPPLPGTKTSDDAPPPPPGPGMDPPPPPPGFDGPPPPPPPGFDGPPPPPGFDGPPPPPIPGGPPPPPGMLGGPAKVVKKKPRKTPQQKMKGLQWTKLPPNKMKGTLFEKFALEYKGINIDYKELEESFSAKIIEKKEEEKKPQVVSILDPKTTQNISIFLSQFKNNSNEELCKELVAMNLKAFTAEHIKQITQFLPSKDDITNIEQYLQGGGELAKLGPADRFALELSKVPQLPQLLQAFSFRLGFEPKKSDIKPDIDLLKTASKEVLGSKKFPQVLELILEIGNFINDGTPRGGITGFKFGSLLKLADTKTTDNTASLVQYLVRLLQKESPELLTFGEELTHAEKAARVSIQQLTSDVATLQKEYNAVQAIAENFPDQQAPFVSFLNKVKDDLEQISKGFKAMEEAYSEAVGLFGEIPKDMSPEEFFGTISKFIESLSEAEKLNQKAAEDAVKAKRREESKAKREQELALKKSGTNDGHESVVEELFGALKGGNVFKNRRVQQNNPGAPAPAQPTFQMPTLRKTGGAPTPAPKP